MPTEDTVILNAITTQVRSSLGDWFRTGPTLMAGPQVRARRWSFFIRYAIQRPQCGRMGLLVKVPRLDERATLAQAVSATELVPYTQLEYEALTKLARAFVREEIAAYCTVRPIAFLPDWNAIVMEELPLRPIKQLLNKPGLLLGRAAEWSELTALFRRAGGWLQIFHSRLGDVQVEPLELSCLEAAIDKAVAELDAAGDRQLELAPLKARLCAMAQTVANVPVPVAGLHGDLSGANVFLTPDGRVGVLDPNGHLRGPIYHDLATLISDPVARISFMLTTRWGSQRQRLTGIRAAVLDGYFGSQPHNVRMLDLYSALVLVQKWARHERRFAALQGPAKIARMALLAHVRSYFQAELDGYGDANRYNEI